MGGGTRAPCALLLDPPCYFIAAMKFADNNLSFLTPVEYIKSYGLIHRIRCAPVLSRFIKSDSQYYEMVGYCIQCCDTLEELVVLISYSMCMCMVKIIVVIAVLTGQWGLIRSRSVNCCLLCLPYHMVK